MSRHGTRLLQRCVARRGKNPCAVSTHCTQSRREQATNHNHSRVSYHQSAPSLSLAAPPTPTPAYVITQPCQPSMMCHNSGIRSSLNFTVITTPEETQDWIETVANALRCDLLSFDHNKAYQDYISDDDQWFAVDTEFTVTNSRQSELHNSDLVLVSIHTNVNGIPSPIVFKCWDTETQSLNLDILHQLSPFFASPFIKKVFHNYAADFAVITTALHTLKRHHLQSGQWTDDDAEKRCKFRGFAGDTLHMTRLLNSGSTHNSLSELARREIGLEKRLSFSEQAMEVKQNAEDEFTDLIRGSKASMYFQVLKNKPDGFYSYASKDAELTLKLAHHFRDKLKEKPAHPKQYQRCQHMREMRDLLDKLTLWNVYTSCWRPFGQLLVEMQQNGIGVNNRYASEILEQSIKDHEAAIKVFKDWAASVHPNGQHVNPNSKMQLAHFLFEDPSSDREIEVSWWTNQYVINPKTGRKVKEIKAVPLPKLGFPSIHKTKITDRVACNKHAMQSLISSKLQPHLATQGYTKQKIDAAINALTELRRGHETITQINTFIKPLQEYTGDRLHPVLNLNTETGRLSCRSPNLQNQPNVNDPYQVRRAFTAEKGNMLIVADYAQLELRVLAYLSKCEHMLETFKEGGDFHSRTAASMYPYIEREVKQGLLYLDEQHRHQIDNDGSSPMPLLKERYKQERNMAKVLNFSIAYGKSAHGLKEDLSVSLSEAKDIVDLWYSSRAEVRHWQDEQMIEAIDSGNSYTMLGRPRFLFGDIDTLDDVFQHRRSDFKQYLRQYTKKHHITSMSSLWRTFCKENKVRQNNMPFNLNELMRRAINTPVQGSAADIVTQAMLNIWTDAKLRDYGYNLILQIHDEVILEGPAQYAKEACDRVEECMKRPWRGMDNDVVFETDIKAVDNWYDGK